MGAAVEAQMGKIVTELGAALGVLLTSLGTRSGLWAALAGAGPLTTADVAAKVSVEPSLVREWLRAQAAGGYLDYDAANETFTLDDAVAAAICYGPGGALVNACATMLSSMGEGFAAFSEAFSTGQGFGWHQRTADHWHGTDAFTRVALPAELIDAAIGAMAGVAIRLASGGSVADVGCGYGTPTLSIAGLFPSAQVLGIDYGVVAAHWPWRTPAMTLLVASSAWLCSSAMSMMVLLSPAWLRVVADYLEPARDSRDG